MPLEMRNGQLVPDSTCNDIGGPLPRGNKSCPDPRGAAACCPNAAVPAQLSGCELVELLGSVVATPE